MQSQNRPDSLILLICLTGVRRSFAGCFSKHYFRIRLGEYRVIYAVINGKIIVINTLLAGARGDIYKKNERAKIKDWCIHLLKVWKFRRRTGQLTFIHFDQTIRQQSITAALMSCCLIRELFFFPGITKENKGSE